MLLPSALSVALLYAPTVIPQVPNSTTSVAASATIEERISLHVSTEVLHFVVAEESAEALASIEYSAGVRTMPGASVLLIAELVVEPAPAPRGPALDRELSFGGEGDGTMAGVLPEGSSRIVARWTGAGQRRGRVVFTLRGVAPGIYSVPVRLCVSVP